MKQPKSIQISIPQPCHEDWNKMTQQEQGRFCSSCQKCVVDFTGFTDEQLYTYLLAHKNERICGRVHIAQTNRAIQLPAQPHSTLCKWVIAAGLVLLFTAVPESKTFAQVPLTEQSVSSPLIDQKHTKPNKSAPKIQGQILGWGEEPIEGAEVSLVTNEGKIIGTYTSDKFGRFIISKIRHGDYKISVHYIGYHEKEMFINTRVNSTVEITLDAMAITGLFENVIIEQTPPLINRFEGGGTKTITSDELEKGAY